MILLHPAAWEVNVITAQLALNTILSEAGTGVGTGCRGSAQIENGSHKILMEDHMADWQTEAKEQLGRIQAPKAADVYDRHRQAVSDWHDACKDFQQAEARRAQAKCALDEASKILAETLQLASQDPTVPQQPIPGNSQAGAQLRQQW